MLTQIERINDEHRLMFAKARVSRDARFDGRFFVAVKTTGIFCRPICPAKLPSEKNVTYYLLAAAAINDGYRPCLRCRPDSAPSSFAWLGIGTTLQRGLTLLSEIPIQSVATVSRRLGISERYLHKLMVNNIGLSPKQYQGHQQVLFAKQLLQQSGLTINDVAYSVGYSSSRQLQRKIQTYCKTTPSALRQQNNVSDPVVALRVYFRPPYHWPQVRDFLLLRAIRGTEQITQTSYTRYFSINGKPAWVKASYNEQAHGFDVKLSLPDLAYMYSTLNRLKKLLDIDADPDLIEQSMQAAGVPKTHITKGLRLPGTWNLFESGCRAILGQQVSVKAAINYVSLVAENLGERIEAGTLELKPAYCFPRPEAIANSDLAFLRMPSSRKDALREYARKFAGNKTPSHDEILSIKGIGQWTLDYFKMRGEGNPDIYLSSDLVVKKMAEKFPVDPEKAAPWRSYLTMQLWQLCRL